MKRFIIILSCLLSTTIIIAQTHLLKGKLISGNRPVEFANIVLQTNDSNYVTGVLSDRKGRFELDNVTTGTYNLQISCLGYTSKHLKSISLNKNMDLGNIYLDSVSVDMNEVVITASHVINKADKKIYLPTSHQIKASTNGMDILQQMKLNRLQVDPMRMTIKSSNEGTVQLRINGNLAEIQEIQAIRPEDIQRVEYHENPSLRYGKGVAVVIDYITKRAESGGYLGINADNSPHTGFGNNGLFAKYNVKKSEFSLNYFGSYRNNGRQYRTNSEIFNYTDGSQFTRIEEGIPNNSIRNHHYLSAAYSYQEPDKWSFMITLKGDLNDVKDKTESKLYPINEPNNSVHMYDDSKEHSKSPSLSLYFQRNLKHKQTLILNIVGTYINSNNQRYYTEDKEDARVTDINSNISGNKYSIIGEAIYEKEFKSSKLSTGLNFYSAATTNKYQGNVTSDTKMHDSNLGIYAEYSSKLGKFNYNIGLAGYYGYYSQAKDEYSKFVLAPRVKLAYSFNDHSILGLKSEISYWTPELSNLNNVEQMIDSLQIRRGNPNLTETQCFSNTLNYEYRLGQFSGNINLFYQYQKHPMMDATLRENDKFIRMVTNQNSWQKFNPEIELKYGPIKDILNISVAVGMNHFNSYGTDYRHEYNNWYYRCELSAYYKNFIVMFQIQNHKNDFYGETIMQGESLHIMMVKYKLKNVNFGVMAFNPFYSKFDRETTDLNRYASSQSCVSFQHGLRIFVASVSWNFSFGRKYKSVEMRLNNEDTDSGTMKSGK